VKFGKMTDTNTDDCKRQREFSEKILSVSFTLLGLLIGFYGIISSAISEAGPWKDAKAEILPFLYFLSVAIVLDCVLGIIAVLGVVGYVRARVAMIILSCMLLASIGVFIAARSLQLLL
jgi:hypothetical protein